MWAHGVIKSLNIAENRGFSGAAGSKMRKMQTLALEAGEEILRDGVVIGVAFARHALLDLIGFKCFAVGAGCILHASVGMKYQARTRPLTPVCHVQRVEGELCVNAVAHGVADNLPGA